MEIKSFAFTAYSRTGTYCLSPIEKVCAASLEHAAALPLHLGGRRNKPFLFTYKMCSIVFSTLDREGGKNSQFVQFDKFWQRNALQWVFQDNTSFETIYNWPGCGCRHGHSTKEIKYLERSTCLRTSGLQLKGRRRKLIKRVKSNRRGNRAPDLRERESKGRERTNTAGYRTIYFLFNLKSI